MEAFHSLEPALILLFVGIIAIATMRPLHMSPIVGYLLVGMIIGPHWLGLIEENHTTHLLSELGVVFLLFDIGLHFSIGHIWDARRDILGLGPAQMALCSIAFGAIAYFAGFDITIALLVGATLALSSTAVAVQTIAEYHHQHCPVGTSATAVLIFQDILAIFLLILANTMGQEGSELSTVIGLALLKTLLALTAAIFAGRYLIGPFFRLIAKTKDEELFTTVALFIVLATAAATGLMELSLTLGAFLAGMIISETPYRHLIQAEVKPFRSLLLGFFFITVGMMLDVQIILDKWLVIIATALAVISIKTLFIFLAARVMHSSSQSAFQIAVLLSQGSEFAFVILAIPAIGTALPEGASAVLISAVALSMALTPLLVRLAHHMASRWADQDWENSRIKTEPETIHDTPVLIIGMGEVGQRVADGLEAHGISYQAFERDHDKFVFASAEGYKVAFGDATDLRLLRTIRLAHAQTVVLTFAHYDVAKTISPIIKQHYPNLLQLVAVKGEAQVEQFKKLGMIPIDQKSFPEGLDMAATVLINRKIDSITIEKWMQRQQDTELEFLPAHELSTTRT